MNEKDILRRELKNLRFSSMTDAKRALTYLRVIELDGIPSVYDLLEFAEKEAPDWYKKWGWPFITWELMSNKYGAAAKHDRTGKVSHFVVLLPPPKEISTTHAIDSNGNCEALMKEKEGNYEENRKSY